MPLYKLFLAGVSLISESPLLAPSNSYIILPINKADISLMRFRDFIQKFLYRFSNEFIIEIVYLEKFDIASIKVFLYIANFQDAFIDAWISIFLNVSV